MLIFYLLHYYYYYCTIYNRVVDRFKKIYINRRTIWDNIVYTHSDWKNVYLFSIFDCPFQYNYYYSKWFFLYIVLVIIYVKEYHTHRLYSILILSFDTRAIQRILLLFIYYIVFRIINDIYKKKIVNVTAVYYRVFYYFLHYFRVYRLEVFFFYRIFCIPTRIFHPL